MLLSKVTHGRNHLFWLIVPEGESITAAEVWHWAGSLLREAEKADYYKWGEAVNSKPTLGDVRTPARHHLPKVPLPPYTVPPPEQ